MGTSKSQADSEQRGIRFGSIPAIGTFLSKPFGFACDLNNPRQSGKSCYDHHQILGKRGRNRYPNVQQERLLAEEPSPWPGNIQVVRFRELKRDFEEEIRRLHHSFAEYLARMDPVRGELVLRFYITVGFGFCFISHFI
jgi:hypothetical protein